MEDKQLILALQTDHLKQNAFKNLVGAYKERLYWHIRKMVYHHDDADDILQDTFVKVFKAIDNFRGDSGLYTWMYRIATNETLRHLEKTKKRKIFSSVDNYEAFTKIKDHTFATLDADAIEIKLQMALDTLPDKQRLVFNMKYFDAISYEEMAKITGKSIGGLKANYHHAVKKIEKFIKDD